MDMKDDLREYAHNDGARLYNEFKEEIIDDIKSAINTRDKEVTIYWGWASDVIPDTNLIENIMEELDLQYNWVYGNDARGIEIYLKELYE